MKVANNLYAAYQLRNIIPALVLTILSYLNSAVNSE